MRFFCVVLLTFSIALAADGWICQVDPALCNGCGNCVPTCPLGAISMHGGDAVIDPEACDGCERCMDYCPRSAIYLTWYTGVEGESAPEAVIWGPNPASSWIHVFGIETAEVTLRDLCGRTVARSVEDGGTSVPVSDISSGVYLLWGDGRCLGPVTVTR